MAIHLIDYDETQIVVVIDKKFDLKLADFIKRVKKMELHNLKNKPCFIIGAGEHAKTIIESLLLNGADIAGCTDTNKNIGEKVLGNIKVLGNDDIIEAQNSNDIYVFNGLGSVKTTEMRAQVYQAFKEKGFHFPVLKHPQAVISSFANIGMGSVIQAAAIIQAGANLHENILINTGAQIDHDCIIDSHSHIAPGSILSGNVKVGENTHIGTQATVIQNIEIGSHVTVGAGVVVKKNVEAGAIIT